MGYRSAFVYVNRRGAEGIGGGIGVRDVRIAGGIRSMKGARSVCGRRTGGARRGGTEGTRGTRIVSRLLFFSNQLRCMCGASSCGSLRQEHSDIFTEPGKGSNHIVRICRRLFVSNYLHRMCSASVEFYRLAVQVLSTIGSCFEVRPLLVERTLAFFKIYKSIVFCNTAEPAVHFAVAFET